ncbi:MAG: biotin/lipoyl-binding protein [Defluviitaleaceae bacterium]|nr:biotin/lipoyl-binding protein [Defluviitaleaceae bacterium]MCL2239102.1 biotin/lipoyl-binding protein [Defluviitaleaceae bacterium]
MSTKVALLGAVLLLLCACGGIRESGSGESALAQIIAGGYLAPFTPELLEPETHTGTVTHRTLTDVHNHTLSPVYLTLRHLYFDSGYRPLAALHVVQGQRVQAGQVLAELEPLDPEEAERLFLRQRNAQIELERFDRAFALEDDRRRVELEEAREARDMAGDGEWHQMALAFSRREIAYRQFLLDNEGNREQILRRLQALDQQIAGDQIIAPMDGAVLWVASLANPGAMILGRPRIMTLAKEDSLFFMHVLGPSLFFTDEENRALFRYGDVLPVTMTYVSGIEYTFYVGVANDPWSTGNRVNMRYLFTPVDAEGFSALLERYEIDMALPFPPTFIARTTARVENALTVPGAAIRSLNERDYVFLYENGYRRRQYVVLGMRCAESAGRYQEILAGLYEGQQVVLWR